MYTCICVVRFFFLSHSPLRGLRLVPHHHLLLLLLLQLLQLQPNNAPIIHRPLLLDSLSCKETDFPLRLLLTGIVCQRACFPQRLFNMGELTRQQRDPTRSACSQPSDQGSDSLQLSSGWLGLCAILLGIKANDYASNSASEIQRPEDGPGGVPYGYL